MHSSQDGLVLAGTVAGQPCNITVDTGSNISIVRPDMLNKTIRDSLETSSQMLRTVTGEMAPIHGRGELTICIGGLTLPHQMWVAEITDECILGLDFLGKHGCQVNLRENVVAIGNEELPLSKPVRSVSLTCCRIIAKETVMVAPHSEALVPGQSTEHSSNQARWVITERPQLQGVLVGSLLLTFRTQHCLSGYSILPMKYSK